MRILYLANNWIGWQILRWLKSQGEDVVGLVIHPASRRKFAEEILAEASLGPDAVFDGSQIKQAGVIRSIGSLKPDMAISISFGYLLGAEFLHVLAGNVVNLHTGYLPFNRGANPNVWSIIDGTPAGVTLHYVDAGIDTGDIIAREKVEVDPVDTGATLFRKLELAAVELFRRTWPLLRSGSVERLNQANLNGTFHTTADLRSTDQVDLAREYLGKDLLNLLRARTFPPYDSAFFTVDGKRVFVRVELQHGDPNEQ